MAERCWQTASMQAWMERHSVPHAACSLAHAGPRQALHAIVELPPAPVAVVAAAPPVAVPELVALLPPVPVVPAVLLVPQPKAAAATARAKASAGEGRATSMTPGWHRGAGRERGGERADHHRPPKAC